MGFAAVLPLLSTVLGGLSVGQSVFPGLLGGQQDAGAEAPTFDDDSSSVIEDEMITQQQKSRQLRRQAASHNQSLSNLQQSSVNQDSLLRIVAGGK